MGPPTWSLKEPCFALLLCVLGSFYALFQPKRLSFTLPASLLFLPCACALLSSHSLCIICCVSPDNVLYYRRQLKEKTRVEAPESTERLRRTFQCRNTSRLIGFHLGAFVQQGSVPLYGRSFPKSSESHQSLQPKESHQQA